MKSIVFGVVALFLASMAQGDGDALYKRGIAIYKSDPEQAFGLFVQAAGAGNSAAMTGAGHCCETGVGTDVDYTKAIEWYEKATKHNSLMACEGLARIYASCPIPEFHDGAKAVKYASVIARKNPRNAKALTLLARAFMRGFDQNRAVDAGKRAATCGGPTQQIERMIAQVEQYEIGMPFPPIATRDWYVQAANMNIQWAVEELAHLASDPEHALHDYALALRMCDRAIVNGDLSLNFLKGNILLETAVNEADLKAAQECYDVIANEGFGTNKVYQITRYREWLTEPSATRCFERAKKIRHGYEVKIPRGGTISTKTLYTARVMPDPVGAEFLYKVARAKGHMEAAAILKRMNRKPEKSDSLAVPEIKPIKVKPLPEFTPMMTTP